MFNSLEALGNLVIITDRHHLTVVPFGYIIKLNSEFMVSEGIIEKINLTQFKDNLHMHEYLDLKLCNSN